MLRTLSSVSPGNLGHGVKRPHEVHTSNLSPGNLVCNAGPLATHRERPAERSPWTASVSLLCLKLAKRCQELKESWQAPQLSLPRSKFSERQKGSSPQQNRKRRGSGTRRRGTNGKWGQGPYMNKKSVSRSRRCQLESADPSGWSEEVPRILF